MTDAAPSRPQSGEPRLKLVETSQPESSEGLRVVLACADDDVEVIAGVLPSLQRQGLRPQILAGAQRLAFVELLKASADPLVCVVCVTTHLGPEPVRMLAESFSIHRATDHRLVVVEVELSRPHALVSTVRRATEALQRQLDMVFIAAPARESAAVSGARHVLDDPSDESETPSASVIVADPLRDDVGPIPSHIRMPISTRSRPYLRVVGAGDDEAAASHSEPPTVRVNKESLVRPARGVSWVGLTAGTFVGVFAVVTSFAMAGAEATPAASSVASLHTVIEQAAEDRVESTAIPVPTMIPSVPSPPSASERLSAALETGEIDSVGPLLVSTHNLSRASWHGAANRCRALSVAEVADWRLPSRGEFSKLAAADILPAGEYWSLSLVMNAEVPSNWVYSTARGRAYAMPKALRAGVVCVRTEASSPQR